VLRVFQYNPDEERPLYLMREIPIDGEVKRIIDIGNASIALAFQSGAFKVFGAASFNFTSSVVFEEA
jgi:hypothetical protein